MGVVHCFEALKENLQTLITLIIERRSNLPNLLQQLQRLGWLVIGRSGQRLFLWNCCLVRKALLCSRKWSSRYSWGLQNVASLTDWQSLTEGDWPTIVSIQAWQPSEWWGLEKEYPMMNQGDCVFNTKSSTSKDVTTFRLMLCLGSWLLAYTFGRLDLYQIDASSGHWGSLVCLILQAFKKPPIFVQISGRYDKRLTNVSGEGPK